MLPLSPCASSARPELRPLDLPKSLVDDEDPRVGFFSTVLRALDAASVPFLVGGAFALTHYVGLIRQTKDLDVFVRRSDVDDALAALSAEGFDARLVFPHWLGKAYSGEEYVDVIWSSGNGIAAVDEAWFEFAPSSEIFGHSVRLCPAEEMVWAKSFIMERERFDGADVAHLLRACGPDLDWPRLVARFGEHWRVLLSQLVLFGFIYPTERLRIPEWVMRELCARLEVETTSPPRDERVCRGTLLSRAQYLVDVHAGYADARLHPSGSMTPEDIAHWTAAIDANHRSEAVNIVGKTGSEDRK